MQKTTYDIVVFLIIVTGVVILMSMFIIIITFLYRRRQGEFKKKMNETNLNHEKELLITKVEIQEQTFQHISSEIHDNINLSLTLAKLNLNTFEWHDIEKANAKLNYSIELITQSISQLSDLSQSLNADIINRHSLLKAIDEELNRIQKTGYLEIDYRVEGIPIYINSQIELIIFRIIQEAFNNIIKHAKTNKAILLINYYPSQLQIMINDMGKGFDPKQLGLGQHAGLKNMEARMKLLGGTMEINSTIGVGTSLNFNIPFNIK